MDMSYAGKLNCSDPLYDILFTRVCPEVKNPVFHVNIISALKVYKYTEEKSSTAVIGKFFRMDDPKPGRALKIRGEYENLRKIRSYGFDRSPNYVVRPISRDERIGLALVEEFINGVSLDHFLKKAIYGKNVPALKDALSRLASFLHLLHSRTQRRRGIVLDPICAYYRKVLEKLLRKNIISDDGRKYYIKLIDKWAGKGFLHRARQTLVHGDATPTNFIFTGRGDVVAIDLERMKEADPAFDVGMICGELKHAFLWRCGDPYLAEPFIRHFLEGYASFLPSPGLSFRELARRNPFYMALAELRIARNGYLGRDYRKKIAHEAMKCLKWGLRTG